MEGSPQTGRSSINDIFIVGKVHFVAILYLVHLGTHFLPTSEPELVNKSQVTWTYEKLSCYLQVSKLVSVVKINVLTSFILN